MRSAASCASYWFRVPWITGEIMIDLTFSSAIFSLRFPSLWCSSYFRVKWHETKVNQHRMIQLSSLKFIIPLFVTEKRFPKRPFCPPQSENVKGEKKILRYQIYSAVSIFRKLASRIFLWALAECNWMLNNIMHTAAARAAHRLPLAETCHTKPITALETSSGIHLQRDKSDTFASEQSFNAPEVWRWEHT